MVLDLETARAAFDASTDFTVGVEEEFALLDPTELGLVSRYDELRRAADADRVLAPSVSGELIASEIEIRSGRGEDFAAAVSAQRCARQRLFALAAEQGIALGSTGTHPWSDYREQQIIPTDHYRRVEEGLKYVAWRNNTFALHVHVGVRGADRAVLRMRSASSGAADPARDLGQLPVSRRPCVRPSQRPDPDLHEELSAMRDPRRLRRLGDVRRLHRVSRLAPNRSSSTPRCGGRSGPTSRSGRSRSGSARRRRRGGESEALAALIVACVAQAARDVDEGVPFEDPPRRLIEENFWRAIRFGVDGELIDLERREVYPGAEALERLLAWTAPVRDELGLDIEFPALNGAQRQLRMLDAGMTMSEVLRGDGGRDARDVCSEHGGGHTMRR